MNKLIIITAYQIKTENETFGLDFLPTNLVESLEQEQSR
jgi:hypothetical protein